MAEKITFNDKSHINPYGTREIQVWDLDINEIKQVVNANADETAANTANVKTNAIAKKTLAEIQALTPDNETLYYVLDDPTPSNNGAWGWDTPGFYKAADAVNAGDFNDTDNVTPATQKSIGDWVKALTPTVNDGAFDDTDNVLSSTQKSVADWTKSLIESPEQLSINNKQFTNRIKNGTFDNLDINGSGIYWSDLVAGNEFSIDNSEITLNVLTGSTSVLSQTIDIKATSGKFRSSVQVYMPSNGTTGDTKVQILAKTTTSSYLISDMDVPKVTGWHDIYIEADVSDAYTTGDLEYIAVRFRNQEVGVKYRNPFFQWESDYLTSDKVTDDKISENVDPINSKLDYTLETQSYVPNKSNSIYGDLYGDNLLTNGNFKTADNWTTFGGGVTVNSDYKAGVNLTTDGVTKSLYQIDTLSINPNQTIGICVKINARNMDSGVRFRVDINPKVNTTQKTQSFFTITPSSSYKDVQLITLSSAIDVDEIASLYIYLDAASINASGLNVDYDITDIILLNMGTSEADKLNDKTAAEIKDLYNYWAYYEGSLFDASDVSKIYKEKKLVTIGDSITEQILWQPHLVKYTGLDWSETETTTGAGGRAKMGFAGTRIRPTYVSTETDPNNADYIGNDIYSRCDDVQYYNPDYIILYGSSNDSYNNMGTVNDATYTGPPVADGNSGSMTLFSAYKGAVEKLLVQNPNAKLILVTLMRASWDIGGVVPTLQDAYDIENTERLPKVDMVREVGSFYGLPVVDLYDDCGVATLNAAPYYQAITGGGRGQVHPNNEGAVRMAELISNNIF